MRILRLLRRPLLSSSFPAPSPPSHFFTPSASRNLPSSSRFSSTLSNPSVGRLNHVAIAVPDLQAAADRYRHVLGCEVSEQQDLPEHGVSVIFIQLPNTKIELLHPLGDNSPIAKFLAKHPSGGLHHLCLEVDNVKESLKFVKEKVRVLDEEPKIGAHGSPVAFLHPKDTDGVLLELEEVRSS